jgi:hypothetical protein
MNATTLPASMAATYKKVRSAPARRRITASGRVAAAATAAAVTAAGEMH